MNTFGEWHCRQTINQPQAKPFLILLFSADLPPPATRERPPGCKTVFVGGLPENATEQLIVEVFEQCGEIIAVRKSKKNFCHIRFAEEYTVDKAMFLSGEYPES